MAALMTQAITIIASEARHEGEVLRHGPSTPALHALDAIYDRLESPADRLLRHAGARLLRCWRDLWRLIGRFDEREAKFKMKMDSFQREANSQGAADQLLGGNAPPSDHDDRPCLTRLSLSRRRARPYRGLRSMHASSQGRSA